jgi:enoyl-[acyl-carrier protein] reductase I
MNFLNLKDKVVVVLGVANKRSVAWHCARVLEEAGATVVFSVRSQERLANLEKLLAGREVHVCDVADDAQVASLAESVKTKHDKVHGLIHSIAFANYENFSGQFHEVSRKDFLQAVDISCYSLIAVSNAFRNLLTEDAGVVTISISTTKMAVESYGFMAPAKAALDSTIAFLAKSFSRFSRVRFNAVGAGLLKTSASAGIPGYLDHYLFAEQVIPRRDALTCEEVANLAAFLVSPRAGGVNAQTVIADAGMSTNYFDPLIVNATVKAIWPADG